MAEAPLDEVAGGLDRTPSGSALTDVLEASARARLTGCLRVEEGQKRSLIFFSAGEIVHAEAEDRRGEEAFREIVASHAGHCRFLSGASCTVRTIHKNWQQLICESQWRLEELRAAGRGRPPVASAPRGCGSAAELGRVPGVTYAVVQRLDGAPVGDGSRHATTLARQARYLGVYARQLGAIFGACDVTRAAAQGREGHLLFIAGGDTSLGILVDGASELASAESAIRDVLERGTGGATPDGNEHQAGGSAGGDP